MHRTKILCVLLGLSLGLSGCMDGPFYALKRANPYYRAQWKKDQALGPTFSQRLQELKLLKSQLASMPVEEQQQWTGQLANIVRADPSSELRAQAVAALARMPSAEAVSALNTASGDDVDKVRMAACRAWRERGDSAAQDMLLSLAQADPSTSVRQAAIESLAGFQDSEVQSTLANLLNDRSPAIQYQVARSLTEITGRDYGGDFDAWRRYMDGEDVPEPQQPNVAEKMWNSLPRWY